MAVQQQFRCLIAAGGTAGHVLPAIAVAEALSERGVLVTFAGSPDRVEARLVPEAGYELDTFRITGLPRRPSVALARVADRSRARRRGPAAASCGRGSPDVVLGGGGFVAGPMVFAASTLRIPAALTEADAHLGLANRLAAPFARRIFLAYPIGDALCAEDARRRSADPGAVAGDPAGRGSARSSSCPQDGRVLGVFGALAGAQALNEFVVDTWGAAGPSILHITGRRDFELGAPAGAARATIASSSETERFGAALSACDLVLSRAGGSVWEIAAAGKPAILVPYPFATGDHQALNARALRARRAARSWCASSTSTMCPSSCAHCSATRRGSPACAAAMLELRGRMPRTRSPTS